MSILATFACRTCPPAFIGTAIGRRAGWHGCVSRVFGTCGR